MREFIGKIIREKIPCYFISPHLDDAALSCGGLINYLAGKTDITVISVFTAISLPPYTLSAKAFLKQCQVTDAEKLFLDRKSEDENIFSALGVKTKHLDFVDAQWRKKDRLNFVEKMFGNYIPETTHIYPTYRWHVISGKVSNRDAGLVDSLKKVLSEINNNEVRKVIFCPIGTGGHVDHVVVRDCCLEVFGNLVLWSDFPYNNNGEVRLTGDYNEAFFAYDKEKKLILIESYKTQYEAMFPQGKINLKDERYYIKAKTLIQVEQDDEDE